MRTCLMMLLALCPAAALAQPVFFDDFDGNALLPHWVTPPASRWEYNVSNSMLNVTALLYPSNPHTGGNFAGMGAAYAPQTDFRADVWMGWEPGDPPHRLVLNVGTSQGGIMASFGYNDDGGNPQIFAGASNQSAFAPAPPPGTHQFTIERIGTQFGFSLNGSPFASFTDLFGTPASIVSMRFLGPFPGQFGPLHVDRVLVVPAPGVWAAAAIGLVWVGRPKRLRPVRTDGAAWLGARDGVAS